MNTESTKAQNKDKPYYREEPSIYAISWPGTSRIKLGFSDQTTTRFNNIGKKIKAYPIVLMVIPGTFTMEKLLHKTFAPWRMPKGPYGKEWFDFEEAAEQARSLFRAIHDNDKLIEAFTKHVGKEWSVVKSELEAKAN